VTIGASAHLARPSRHLGQEKDGRAAAYPDLITVASHTKKDNPAELPSRPSSPQTTSARRYVLTPRVAGQMEASEQAMDEAWEELYRRRDIRLGRRAR
jgi:hypothetical protein